MSGSGVCSPKKERKKGLGGVGGDVVLVSFVDDDDE